MHNNNCIILKEIIPNLFVGNSKSAQSFEGSIISLYETTYLCEQSNLLKIYIPDEESYPIKAHFKDTNTFIFEKLKQDTKVLVHCQAGISRSVTIIVAYLMRAYLIDAEEALAIVQKKHPIAQPNSGFMNQLYKYQKIRNYHNMLVLPILLISSIKEEPQELLQALLSYCTCIPSSPHPTSTSSAAASSSSSTSQNDYLCYYLDTQKLIQKQSSPPHVFENLLSLFGPQICLQIYCTKTVSSKHRSNLFEKLFSEFSFCICWFIFEYSHKEQHMNHLSSIIIPELQQALLNGFYSNYLKKKSELLSSPRNHSTNSNPTVPLTTTTEEEDKKKKKSKYTAEPNSDFFSFYAMDIQLKRILLSLERTEFFEKLPLLFVCHVKNNVSKFDLQEARKQFQHFILKFSNTVVSSNNSNLVSQQQEKEKESNEALPLANKLCIEYNANLGLQIEILLMETLQLYLENKNNQETITIPQETVFGKKNNEQHIYNKFVKLFKKKKIVSNGKNSLLYHFLLENLETQYYPPTSTTSLSQPSHDFLIDSSTTNTTTTTTTNTTTTTMHSKENPKRKKKKKKKIIEIVAIPDQFLHSTVTTELETSSSEVGDWLANSKKQKKSKFTSSNTDLLLKWKSKQQEPPIKEWNSLGSFSDSTSIASPSKQPLHMRQFSAVSSINETSNHNAASMVTTYPLWSRQQQMLTNKEELEEEQQEEEEEISTPALYNNSNNNNNNLNANETLIDDPTENDMIGENTEESTNVTSLVMSEDCSELDMTVRDAEEEEEEMEEEDMEETSPLSPNPFAKLLQSTVATSTPSYPSHHHHRSNSISKNRLIAVATAAKSHLRNNSKTLDELDLEEEFDFTFRSSVGELSEANNTTVNSLTTVDNESTNALHSKAYFPSLVEFTDQKSQLSTSAASNKVASHSSDGGHSM